MRVDPADGNAYSLDDFVLAYGGSHSAPPAQWFDAMPTLGGGGGGGFNQPASGGGVSPPLSGGGFSPPPMTPAAPAEGERRIDPADGAAYSLDEFIEVYGGSRDMPPPNWLQACALIDRAAEQSYAASFPASVAASAAGPEWGVPCSGQSALAAAERRVDPADGNAYTLEDFVDAYGGSSAAPPFQWHQALAAGAPADSLAGAVAATPMGWGPPSVASGALSGLGGAGGFGAAGSLAGAVAPSGGAGMFAGPMPESPGGGPLPPWAGGAGASFAEPAAAAAASSDAYGYYAGAPGAQAAAAGLGLGGSPAIEPLGLAGPPVMTFGADTAPPGSGFASPCAGAGPPRSVAPSDHRSLQSEGWGAPLSDGLPMGASALASPPSQLRPVGFGPGRRIAAFPAAGAEHPNPFDSGFLPPSSLPGSCGGAAAPAAVIGAAPSAADDPTSGWGGPVAWGTPGPASVAEPIGPQSQQYEHAHPDHHGHGFHLHHSATQDAPPQYYQGQDVPPQPQHFEHPSRHEPDNQQPHHHHHHHGHHGHTQPHRSHPQPQHPSPAGQAAPPVSIEMVAPLVKTVVGTEIQQLQQELKGLYSEMRELSDDYRKLRVAKEAPDAQAEKAGELSKLRTTVADLQETLASTVTSVLDERLKTAEQGREKHLASTISSVLDAKLGLARVEPAGAEGRPPAASLMDSAHQALNGSRPTRPPSGGGPPGPGGGGGRPALPELGGPAAPAGPPSLSWVTLPARGEPLASLPASPQLPGAAPRPAPVPSAILDVPRRAAPAAGPEPALGATVDLSWVAKALGAAAPAAPRAAAPHVRWEFVEGEAEMYLGKFAELERYLGREVPRAVGLEQAGPVLRRTGVSSADLATIWDMCDIDRDGCLTPRGFACAMSLARSRSQGAPLPPVLPAALLEAAGKHAPKVPSRGSAAGLGPPAPEPAWAVSEEQLRKYWSIFLATERRGQDALSHSEAREVLGRSGLPAAEVSRAVRLADVDVDGLLGFDEFACALHLVTGRRQGLELPQRLPPELVSSLPRLPAGPGLPLERGARPPSGDGGASPSSMGPPIQDPRPAAGRAPEGGWAMDPQQLEQYRAIFLGAGGSSGSDAGGGLLRQQDAREVLRRSGLPEHTLSRIWGVAFTGSGPQVSAVEFACAMHLACAARHGVEIPSQMPSELEASARSSLEAPALSSTASVGQCAGSSWSAGPADLQSYRATFDALAQGRDRIWPDDAKGVFESYSTETDDLNRIWVLSDTDGDGQLTFAEFACAMHLLSQLSQGLPVPAALPPELLSSIQAAEAAPAGPNGPAWGGWAVGTEELQRYRGAFDKMARGRDRLGPDELGEVFGCSGLSADEMNQVWNMSDLDGDGQLVFLEFACAVHLLGLRRQGWPLPAEAPQELLGSLRS